MKHDKKKVDELFDKWMEDAPSDAFLKHSAASRQAHARPTVKEKLRKSQKFAQNRPEVKELVRRKTKEALNRPDVKERHTQANRKAQNNPELRERRSAIFKATHARPEVKAKHSKAVKEAYQRPEVKANFAAAMLKVHSRQDIKDHKRERMQQLKWFTDGTNNRRLLECPEGWWAGRSEMKPYAVVTCPHCGKSGGSTAMGRWHFDNCKHK